MLLLRLRVTAAALATLAACASGCTDRPVRATSALPQPPPPEAPGAATEPPDAYEPHPSIEVLASPFAEAMVARDRVTGAVARDLVPALAGRGFADRNRYALDFGAVDAIGVALRRSHTGKEPDAVLAVDGASGEILWQRDVPDPSKGGKLVAAVRPPGGAPLVLIAGIVGEQVALPGGGAGWASPVHALDGLTGELRFAARLAPKGEVRLAAAAAGVVVLASRCSWLSQFDCGGIVAGLDAATGEVRWSAEIPAGSREVATGAGQGRLALAVDGRIDVLDARTGVRTSGFAAGRTPARILFAPGGLILCGAGGLEAVTADGAPRWSRAGDASVLGVDGGRLVLATRFTEEVLDAATGERLCHRNRAGGLPGAWAGAPPVSAAAGEICRWPARPFGATIRGTLTVDGRPRGRARVSVQGAEAVTDGDGAFAAAIDAPGEIRVEPVWEDLARNPRRPCVSGEPATVAVEENGRSYDVGLVATTRPRACADACDPVDCE